MEYWYITGTGSGLGKAIAEQALKRGEIIVTGLSRHAVIEHPGYIHKTIDLSKRDQCLQFEFEKTDGASRIVLINNAGSLGKVEHAGKLMDEIIADTYFLNCIAPHILINKFMQKYRNVDCEKIMINITSGAASSPYDGWSIYCSTKASLDMMSLCIAKEIEIDNSNFRIFSIAPGVMDTAMQDEIRKTGISSFSRRNKFDDLKKNNELRDVNVVATRYIQFIERAYRSGNTIQTITL